MALAEADVVQPALAEMPPGPGLALLLGAREYGPLDDFDIVEVARSARRLASWAASLELGAVAELAARRKRQGTKLGAWDSEVGEWVTDEVAAALTLSGGTAAHLVVMAEQLAESLPLTFHALHEGRIDAAKARVIADGLRSAQPDVAAAVERQVLPAAPDQTCAQLRYAIRKAIGAVDPDGCAERRRLAEEARCVELWDNDEGTGDLTGRSLPAAAASAAWNRINAIAAGLKADGDERTIDQLRADVFLALLRNERPDPPSAPPPDSSPDPAGPGDPTEDESRPDSVPEHGHAARGEDAAGPSHGEHSGHGDPRPTAQQANDLNDVQDLDDLDVRQDVEDTDVEAGERPGVGSGLAPLGASRAADAAARSGSEGADRAVAAEVAGHVHVELARLTDGLRGDVRRRRGQGALVAEAVRRIKAATAELNLRWCTVTVDRGGTVRHGAGSYRVPAGMRRWADARDATCRFPGCRRHAARCDADHTHPHHLGGVTCPCNVALLCRRHHRLKQRPEWQLIQVWPGVLVWIAPTGHWYVVGPGPE